MLLDAGMSDTATALLIECRGDTPETLQVSLPFPLLPCRLPSPPFCSPSLPFSPFSRVVSLALFPPLPPSHLLLPPSPLSLARSAGVIPDLVISPYTLPTLPFLSSLPPFPCLPLLAQKRIDASLEVVKASSLTLNAAEFSYDPAVCSAYWDARRALIPMVGAVREVRPKEALSGGTGTTRVSPAV